MSWGRGLKNVQHSSVEPTQKQGWGRAASTSKVQRLHIISGAILESGAEQEAHCYKTVCELLGTKQSVHREKKVLYHSHMLLRVPGSDPVPIAASPASYSFGLPWSQQISAKILLILDTLTLFSEKFPKVISLKQPFSDRARWSVLKTSRPKGHTESVAATQLCSGDMAMHKGVSVANQTGGSQLGLPSCVCCSLVFRIRRLRSHSGHVEDLLNTIIQWSLQ